MIVRRIGSTLLMLAVAFWMKPVEAGLASSVARDYLGSIRSSPELQQFLDRAVAELEVRDAKLRHTGVRIALLDLGHGNVPLLAHRHGETPVYPASVVKFVYLMAAYAWQEDGLRRIDSYTDTQLTLMIYNSSNRATQRLFAWLTGTEPGPALAAEAYRAFSERRFAVVRWLQGLGITDLHCVNPTYDGDGDLVGRDKQFISDRGITGGLPVPKGKFGNRNAMTAVGTAKLLALLATDRALSPEDSVIVRRRMRRNPAEQPHLIHRIAGGAARQSGLEVYSKSGTWGPIYADAGIVHQVSSGREFVLVVFTEADPAYRGDFIAELTERCTRQLLAGPGG
jgi:hypothetical protein